MVECLCRVSAVNWGSTSPYWFQESASNELSSVLSYLEGFWAAGGADWPSALQFLSSFRERSSSEQLKCCFILNLFFIFASPLSQLPNRTSSKSIVVFLLLSYSGRKSSAVFSKWTWAGVAVFLCRSKQLLILSLVIDLPLPVGIWFVTASLPKTSEQEQLCRPAELRISDLQSSKKMEMILEGRLKHLHSHFFPY